MWVFPPTSKYLPLLIFHQNYTPKVFSYWDVMVPLAHKYQDAQDNGLYWMEQRLFTPKKKKIPQEVEVKCDYVLIED